jgi:hypothetical protein
MLQGTTIYYSVTVVFHITFKTIHVYFKVRKRLSLPIHSHDYIYNTLKLSQIHKLGEPYRFVIGN